MTTAPNWRRWWIIAAGTVAVLAVVLVLVVTRNSGDSERVTVDELRNDPEVARVLEWMDDDEEQAFLDDLAEALNAVPELAEASGTDPEDERAELWKLMVTDALDLADEIEQDQVTVPWAEEEAP